MTQCSPEFAILKEISENDEPSSWTRSVLAVDPSGKKVFLTCLHKEKIIQFYTYRESSEKLTPETRQRLLDKATALFSEEDARFAAVNKKVMGLTHPNIAKVLHIGIHPETKQNVIVYEFYPLGKSITDATEGMTIEAQVPLFLNMIEAVNFMHQNSLLHLNLKNKRIRVDDDLNFSVKLTDYGYAADVGKFEDHYLPAPGYCAPEVALKQRDKIGKTSDLYSLGVIMYQCMARVAPFPHRYSADTPVALAKAVGDESAPMKPSEKNPHILEMPYTGGIPYKIDSKKVLALEEIVMNLIKKDITKREILTAPKLLEAISAIYKDVCKDRVPPSSSISLGI